jgi:uncharacterized protein YbjT (DUF2867 family)
MDRVACAQAVAFGFTRCYIAQQFCQGTRGEALNIFVCGANGFIGAAICERLAREGHRVIRGVRRPRSEDEIAIDYASDIDPAQWLPRLVGIDVVVNAVGIIVERGAQKFDAVHRRAPIALFEACTRAGVRRVVQVSALGADLGTSAYFSSKRDADRYLSAQPVESVVVRPALVYGADGTSARLFRALACLPLHVLPAGGRQVLRPLHIDDLVEAIVRLIEVRAMPPAARTVELVGGTAATYADMLRVYRASMGLPPAWTAGVPAWLMDAAAAIGDRIPGAMFDRDTWQMLQAGNTADVDATVAVLGRTPRGIEAFIGPREASCLRQAAFAVWRAGLLRASLAVVWFAAALVSAFVYPRSASLALLGRLGLTGTTALVALYGACLLDFALGVATLARPGRRLWLVQIALIAFYSAAIAVALPAYLAEPFGPVVKNIPILAILFVLLCEETQS